MDISSGFYKVLNESIEPCNNKLYINETNRIMASVLQSKTPKNNLIVIGAGNMQDMSLVFFLRHFKKVYLTDIDIHAIKKNLPKNVDSNRVFVHQLDILGLDETQFFTLLEQRLLACKTLFDVQYEIKRTMQLLLTYQFASDWDHSFDAVYVSPIYTQLLYRQVEQFIDTLTQKGLTNTLAIKAKEVVLQAMIQIIDHINSSFKKLVKVDGLLFVASDIFTLDEGPFSTQIMNSITDDTKMESLYQQYHQVNGFGLGDYGVYSLSQMVKRITRHWLLWNQSKHQTYALTFQAFEKIDE